MKDATARLEAFSDGVFAIAITLLVLDMRVPARDVVTAAGGLFPALLRLWPSFLAYVLSFVIIGIMWANHHSLLECVGRIDRYFVMLNVGLLMGISFVPFPTALLAAYLMDTAQRRAAVVTYAATFFILSLLFNAVWRYAAYRGRLLAPEAKAPVVAAIHRRYALGPACYGAAVLIAWYSPWASLAVQGLMALLYLLPEAEGQV
jgi:TMEM175 potassium channel family protein